MGEKIKKLNKKEYFKQYYQKNKNRACYQLSNLRKLLKKGVK